MGGNIPLKFDQVDADTVIRIEGFVMDSKSIIPTATIPGLGSLQRIQSSDNSGRRRQQNPQRRRVKAKAKYSNKKLYTPDGHVEPEEQGVRVDVSA